MNPLDPRLEAIRRALAAHRPQRLVVTPEVRPASVALLVRPASAAPELLFIRRAEFDGDPWSGHVAFPGGRRDPLDADAQATAVRETVEEVGIDLARVGTPLGALDDVHPRAGAPPVLVSPFVFGVPADVVACPNHEVCNALWVPLPTLASAPARAEHVFHLREAGVTLRFPALRHGGYVIWGLTYRILGQFLELAGFGALP